jgi:hypothetical protein
MPKSGNKIREPTIAKSTPAVLQIAPTNDGEDRREALR